MDALKSGRAQQEYEDQPLGVFNSITDNPASVAFKNGVSRSVRAKPDCVTQSTAYEVKAEGLINQGGRKTGLGKAKSRYTTEHHAQNQGLPIESMGAANVHDSKEGCFFSGLECLHSTALLDRFQEMLIDLTAIASKKNKVLKDIYRCVDFLVPGKIESMIHGKYFDDFCDGFCDGLLSRLSTEQQPGKKWENNTCSNTCSFEVPVNDVEYLLVTKKYASGKSDYKAEIDKAGVIDSEYGVKSRELLAISVEIKPSDSQSSDGDGGSISRALESVERSFR